jgi:Domain of unknown function (DUF222)
MLATQDVQAPTAGAEAGEELKQLLHQVNLLLIKASGVAARFAATDEYDKWGYASPIDWIRFNCHQTSTVAADLIAVGQKLERVPDSTQAVVSGEIGFAHLKAMVRTANAVGSRFDEALLLAKARESSPGKFYYLCNHYRHSAERKGYEGEQADMVENRKLWISTGEDGAIWVNGVFDPIGGASIRTWLEPLARRSDKLDDRCREKRMADALVDLSLHALDSGLIPQSGSLRTHLQVTASLETLLGLPGAPGADMELSPMPVSTKSVERLACDASVTRIVLDSKSVVIDVGRARRTISGPARKALNVRDRGCTWPGCERPASWTSGHHLRHWIHGGTNAPGNLTLLCYRHHWNVHEGGWQIVRDDDGRIVTIPPTVSFGSPWRGPD